MGKVARVGIALKEGLYRGPRGGPGQVPSCKLRIKKGNGERMNSLRVNSYVL